MSYLFGRMDPMRNRNSPKHLYDMEIDEISLVDRGANQHAAIVFSKALGSEEDAMPENDLYDSFGEAVEEVEVGDIVYDSSGNEYVIDYDDDEDDGAHAESEYEGVGKSGMVVRGISRPMFAASLHSTNALKGYKSGAAWRKGGAYLTDDVKRATAGAADSKMGRAGQKLGFYRNRALAGVAGAGVLAGGGAYALNKSLGDVVMEELSKAATDEDREYIIAKAMDEVEIAKNAAYEAWERVAQQDDAMLAEAFISKASEFNLPVDPVDFGLILKAASTVLDADQLDLLEQLFTGVGEVLYDEIGYQGDTDNVSVMDMVDSYVGDYVGKADASHEMISTAVFEMNPEAYDAYLSEQNWR